METRNRRRRDGEIFRRRLKDVEDYKNSEQQQQQQMEPTGPCYYYFLSHNGMIARFGFSKRSEEEVFMEDVCDLPRIHRANFTLSACRDQILVAASISGRPCYRSRAAAPGVDFYCFDVGSTLDTKNKESVIDVPGIKNSNIFPYMVVVDDIVYAFGTRYSPEVSSECWGWSLIRDKGLGWVYQSLRPHRGVLGAVTRSHFVFRKKVFLLFRAPRSMPMPGFVFSYNTSTSEWLEEDDLTTEVAHVFHYPKVVLDDILLICHPSSGQIGAFDILTCCWFDPIDGLQSLEPVNNGAKCGHLWSDDTEECFFILKSPLCTNEVYLVRQVNYSLSVALIQLKLDKYSDGKTFQVSGRVLREFQPLRSHGKAIGFVFSKAF